MNTESLKDNNYVCPVCKQSLTHKTHGLFCQKDGIEYPVKNGIVDFVSEDLTKSANSVFRLVDEIDKFANIYEGPSWYGIADKLSAELDLPSIEDMAKMMTETVDATDGLGLDVACGTGFFTRSSAKKMRNVYGIDISMGMLEKATGYAREKGIRNVCFARSRVERLPFPDGLFDGVTCSGALHLFQNTVEALNEMARVMKTGTRLAVLTIVKQRLPALKTLLDRLDASNPIGKEKSLELVHLFDVEELESYLSQTGFKGFAYDTYGPFILFHAEKG